MSCCDECDVTKILETLREDPVIAFGLEVAPVQTIRSVRGFSLRERRAMIAGLQERPGCGSCTGESGDIPQMNIQSWGKNGATTLTPTVDLPIITFAEPPPFPNPAHLGFGWAVS